MLRKALWKKRSESQTNIPLNRIISTFCSVFVAGSALISPKQIFPAHELLELSLKQEKMPAAGFDSAAGPFAKLKLQRDLIIAGTRCESLEFLEDMTAAV